MRIPRTGELLITGEKKEYLWKKMKNQAKYFQNLFFDLLNDYGRVFVVVKYSDATTIGNRGFTDEEKKKGIVLVFNQKNHRTLQWTEDGSILATLSFGINNRPENCFLHCDDIVALFSPDAKITFERWDTWKIENVPEESQESKQFEKQKSRSGKIISFDDFKNKK